MKNLNFMNDHMELIVLFSIIALCMIIIFINKYLSTQSIKKSFIEKGFAQKTNESYRFSYIKFFKTYYFYRFNLAKASADFHQAQSFFNEILNEEFVRFERKYIFFVGAVVKGITANWDIKIVPRQKDFILGTDGVGVVMALPEQTSFFVFGFSGSRKTTLIRSYLKMLKRIYQQTLIITISGKEEDFKEGNDFLYDNESSFLEILKTQVEEQRQIKDKRTLVVVIDEAHLSSTELRKYVTNTLIKMGRALKIYCFISTQSPRLGDLKDLDVSLSTIKILNRQAPTYESCESVFGKEIADLQHNKAIPHGFGFVVSTSESPKKIRFYYE
jgi:hypothetical protein